MAARYYLGIDGGATKTSFVLTDSAMHNIASCTLGSSNPQDVGFEAACQILRSGIVAVLDSHCETAEVSLFAGLSGGITGNNKARFAEFLSGFGFAAFSNGSDFENALEVALRGTDGIVAVCGTGSVYARRHNGNLKLFGGYGHLFDDGLSAYSIARAAIIAEMKAEDLETTPSLLRTCLLSKLGVPTLRSALPTLLSGGKRAIAPLSLAVLDALERGSTEARRALLSLLPGLAADIATLAEPWVAADAKARVVLTGGVAQRYSHLFLEELISEMKRAFPRCLKNMTLEVCPEPPVVGSLLLAAKNANI